MRHVRTLSPAVVLVGISLAALSASSIDAQQAGSTKSTSSPDPWDQMRFLVGDWSGTGQGTPGTSTIERHIEFIVGGKFLWIRNTSTFKPQPGNPTGEVHQDWGVLSYDTRRKKFVLREFHSEGFMTQYTLEEVSDDGRRMVFITEVVENAPPAFAARLTWNITGKRTLEETFELAPNGRDFKPCVEATLKREG